jgi:hypothetical protein
MLSLRAHFAFPTLFLAAGLCLAACSTKENTTALLVNVTLDSSAAKPDAIDTVAIVVTRGAAKFTSKFPWSDANAGTLKATLLLPAEAVGKDSLDVQGTLLGNVTATPSGPLPDVTITAGKATGPIAVVLKSNVPIVDGGADALPGDGPKPDLAGGPEAGQPEAGVTPDARIDEPGQEAAVADAILPSDVVQPVEVAPLPDAPQLPDVANAGVDVPQPADAGVDVPQPADAGADAPQPADAVDAGADMGADSLAGPVWRKAENVVNDPFDSATDMVVAVDPVNQHVYVMWVDWSSSAVRVKRWNQITGKWGNTHTLENNASGNPEIIQVGVDGAGNVIAAWQHSVSSDDILAQIGGVRVSRSIDGESWSAAESVTPLRQVVEMRMAVARNGQARIAFTERPTSSPYTNLLYSAHFDGTTWTSGPNPLAPEDPNDQASHYPSIAIGDDGSGIVLFTQKDSSGSDSVAASTFAGATVNDFVILDSDTTYNLTDMAVAVNRSGQGVVVWADTDGAMLRSYSPSSGKWAAARNIGNVGMVEPSVVMAQDGTVTVAWSQWVNGFYNVWTMEGTVSGAWTTPMALETDNLSIPNDQYASDVVDRLPNPWLAVDGDGNVLAFWSKKTQAIPTREFALEGRRKLAGTPNGVWQPTTELAKKSKLLPWGLSLAVGDHGLGAAGYFWKDPESTNDPDAYQAFVSLFR